MKWVVLAAVAAAVAIYAFVPQETDVAPDATEDVERPPAPARPPTLTAAAAEDAQPARSDGRVEPAPPEAENAKAPEPIPQREVESARVAPGGRRLGPGETFTPLSELEVVSREEREAAAEATRTRLQALVPLRTTWSEAPLQDVLREFSAQSGLQIALGPQALERGQAIVVTEPLAGIEPPVEPSVWTVLAALSRKHRFLMHAWKGGVYLKQPPDPERMEVRIHAVHDMLRVEWGQAAEIEKRDRLQAVFAELASEASDFGKTATVRVHGSSLIVRAPRAAQERLGTTLDGWRADPKAFRHAYESFVARRHDTVSGAPPRK